MTFKVFAIEISNFKCYRGTHEFEFPQTPGLYYFTGRNFFNKRLGANGCGKTSLIDALEWTLYGKTSRGLRAGDIISWGEKTCTVSVTLMVGEEELEVSRSQNPNKIKINGRPVSQEEILKLIRLNQDAFNASVVLPQFGRSFFDLGPADKLSLFAQVMDLDYWLEKSKRAGDEANKIEGIIDSLESDIANIKGKLEVNRADIKDLKAKRDSHADVVKKRIDDIKAARAECKDVIKAKQGKLKKLERQQKGLKREFDAVVDAANDCALEFGKVNTKFYDYNAAIQAAEKQIKEYRLDINSVEKLGETCPTCMQVIDPDHVESHQSKIRKRIKKLEKEISSNTDKIDSISKKLSELRGDTLELSKLKQDIEKRYADCKDSRKDTERSIEQNEVNLRRFDKEIEKVKAEDNPYDSIIKSKRNKISDLKAQLVNREDSLVTMKSEFEAVNFWVGGFKRIRLFVVEEALRGLELEVNSLLVTLGLHDWSITFDIERENKSGGVTKGFSVFIQSPKHDEPVRFESWSGGETQRLRLAGDLGLANLIMEQAGFVSHIEMIDEPSEHMSPEGIEDMVETIHQRAVNSGKQIWLVDHNTMGFGEFAGVLTSVMDEKGNSNLEYKGVS